MFSKRLCRLPNCGSTPPPSQRLDRPLRSRSTSRFTVLMARTLVALRVALSPRASLRSMAPRSGNLVWTALSFVPSGAHWSVVGMAPRSIMSSGRDFVADSTVLSWTNGMPATQSFTIQLIPNPDRFQRPVSFAFTLSELSFQQDYPVATQNTPCSVNLVPCTCDACP